MQLGIISDVHANLPALEAVLDDMPPVDTVVCLGDIVGYNPYPAACVDRVRAACDVIVQGNHDRDVREAADSGQNRQAIAGAKLARERLSDEQLTFLEGLPSQVVLSDRGLLAVHSHPTVPDRYVVPRNVDQLAGYLTEYDGVLLGHTHQQHAKEFDDGVVVNPGSVGQPRDGTTASYAVLDVSTLVVDLRRTDYDVWEVIQAIDDAGLPEETAARLLPDGVEYADRRSERPGPW